MSNDESIESYLERAKDFNLKISKAVSNNDIKKVKSLLNSKKYPNLKLDEKESQTFIAAYISDKIEVLKYLIIDYKIKEENSLDRIKDLSSHVEQIFTPAGIREKVLQIFNARKLSEELNENLKNKTENSKKPKV